MAIGYHFPDMLQLGLIFGVTDTSMESLRYISEPMLPHIEAQNIDIEIYISLLDT